MSTSPDSSGLDPEAISAYITTTYAETDVVTMEGGAFFSLDPEKHWPNFATIVWTDDFDQASDLSSASSGRTPSPTSPRWIVSFRTRSTRDSTGYRC